MSDKEKQDKLIAMLEKLASESDDDTTEDNYDENHVANLQKTYESFLEKHNFKKGQLVKWKKGLCNRPLPMENQPAIVMEILENKLLQSEQETASTYFREPLDIVLGLIDRDGTLITFHYDSGRFEPYS
ncbi:hypothetical protein [Candidatus Parabeggiatoa sp. HSG14]|uniref:hypothetical protein n=1 Tax=Candidatus Parabeggiatoa sp. HSG14 TaxID=3055593 RepID=UPI0025A8D984|nr:hypothetical protein [Thiotrichales bacterium HSG14]